MEPEQSGSPEPAPEWRLRPGEPGDLAFVAGSWRRHCDPAPRTGVVPAPSVAEWRACQAAFIDQALRTSDLVVACPPDRREQILGWCCYRREVTGVVIHYVFVKPYYRRKGIGEDLLLQSGAACMSPTKTVYITHPWRQPHAEGIGAIVAGWMRAGGIVEYNPALIFGGKTT